MYKEYQLVPIIIKFPYCNSPHDTILIIFPYNLNTIIIVCSYEITILILILIVIVTIIVIIIITLWLFNITMENHHFLAGKIHYKSPFSIAM